MAIFNSNLLNYQRVPEIRATARRHAGEEPLPNHGPNQEGSWDFPHFSSLKKGCWSDVTFLFWDELEPPTSPSYSYLLIVYIYTYIYMYVYIYNIHMYIDIHIYTRVYIYEWECVGKWAKPDTILTIPKCDGWGKKTGLLQPTGQCPEPLVVNYGWTVVHAAYWQWS